MVHSISDLSPLSTLSLPTGLNAYPSRQPTPYIPRHTSFAFHPMEMLYAVGQPDGSGVLHLLLNTRKPANHSSHCLVKITGCKLT
jgi:hypothetical protein